MPPSTNPLSQALHHVKRARALLALDAKTHVGYSPGRLGAAYNLKEAEQSLFACLSRTPLKGGPRRP